MESKKRQENFSGARTTRRAFGGGLAGLILAGAGVAEGAGPTNRPAAPTAHAGAAIPEWFLHGIEEKIRDGGVWIADNSPYRVEDNGIEAYGIEWRKGIGGMSMVGRLYSVRDGGELATHWEFRLFWHPVDREAKAYQFGVDGTLGWGVQTPPDADGVVIIEQTFAGPDGGTMRVRHESRTEGDREMGQSFNRVDDEWQPRRSYTWVRRR